MTNDDEMAMFAIGKTVFGFEEALRRVARWKQLAERYGRETAQYMNNHFVTPELIVQQAQLAGHFGALVEWAHRWYRMDI